MPVLRWICFAAAVIFSIPNAQAQTTIANEKAKLDEADKNLSSNDPNVRIGALRTYLASGDPVLVRRARQVGLTSSDPDMRRSTLQSIFDSGGPFTVVFDLNGDGKNNQMMRWLDHKNGSWDPDLSHGTFGFAVEAYDQERKCWKFINNPYCAIYLSGETISLRQWSGASGSLTLNREGKLVGQFLVSNAKVPVRATLDLLN